MINRHLDALAGRQDADGGWRFSFAAWTPITRFEWGGWVCTPRQRPTLTAERANGTHHGGTSILNRRRRWQGQPTLRTYDSAALRADAHPAAVRNGSATAAR